MRLVERESLPANGCTHRKGELVMQDHIVSKSSQDWDHSHHCQVLRRDARWCVLESPGDPFRSSVPEPWRPEAS